MNEFVSEENMLEEWGGTDTWQYTWVPETSAHSEGEYNYNLLHNKSEAATRYAASNFISALDYCPPVHDTTTISNITTWILTSALVLINNIV